MKVSRADPSMSYHQFNHASIAKLPSKIRAISSSSRVSIRFHKFASQLWTKIYEKIACSKGPTSSTVHGRDTMFQQLCNRGKLATSSQATNENANTKYAAEGASKATILFASTPYLLQNSCEQNIGTCSTKRAYRNQDYFGAR